MAIQKFGMAVPNAVSTDDAEIRGRVRSDRGEDAQPERKSQGEQEGEQREFEGDGEPREDHASSTGWPVRNDRPQSPRNQAAEPVRYWT